MNNIEIAKALFFKGLACLEKQDFANAENHFISTLELAPQSIPALTNLAIAQYEQKKIIEASITAKRTIEIDPKNIDAHLMLSACHKEQEKYDEALATCESIIRIDPAIAQAHHIRGYVLSKLKKYREAIDSFDRALAIQPEFPDVFLNRGSSLRNLKDYDEALQAYDKALALKPDLAEAWLGRGNIFYDLKRYDEAFAAYDKALGLKPDLAEAWLGRANALLERKRTDEAFAAYDSALAHKPELAEGWLGRGNVFSGLKRYDEAFAAYDKAIVLNPDLADAWLSRGNVFVDLKRYDEAFAAYDKALALEPNLAEAWLGRGNGFLELKRFDEAFAAYDKAFGSKPELVGVEGSRLHTKMCLCDWSNFDAECKELITSVKNNKANAVPFALLGIPSSPDDQLQCARLWVAEKCPSSQEPIWRGDHYNHDRIRVAYVSADFRQHAISYLMAGMFECHDKSRFEITAISTSPDDRSEIRQRLKSTFEHFIDVTSLSDEEASSRIREAEIDILIDLTGFTQGARPGVFASRPAPIQVNYLGYPGTMGASYIDYIIADQTVIPDGCKKFYSEKIAFLPNTYQVNDRKRVISDKPLTRSNGGLPSQGFIFCCFNNSYKIIPRVFDSWMRVLKQVEGSALWLLNDNASAVSNLKKEAAARGVSPERLVFAERVPLSEHLARHKLADLFLDTLPYNAHTTTSDALWAGMPVLTCLGETFAGRVAASLLDAIGLPELIATTPEIFEQTAIDLATHPERLAAIKHKLAENRLTTPLFNTKLFTKHIEAAYTMMHERHQAGLAPDHMIISD